MKFAILRFISTLAKILLRIKGVHIGNGSLILGMPYIASKGGKSSISIGKNVTIHSLRKMNGVLTNRSSLITGAPNAKIILEDGAGISGTTIYAISTIKIGESSLIGADSLILDNDMHYQSPEGTWLNAISKKDAGQPILIGKNCFIGARCIILKGVTIGNSCIIGAGTVLTKNVPDNHMAYGNPAIVVPRKQQNFYEQN